MLTRIKDYWCDHKPEESDLIDAIVFARDWKCIIRVHWNDKQYGHLHINITPTMTLTECKRKIFRKYI